MFTKNLIANFNLNLIVFYSLEKHVNQKKNAYYKEV